VADLFYRPDLKPKRDYMSDAEIDSSEVVGTGGEETPEGSSSDLDELKEKIDDIIDIIGILPEDMQKAMLPSLRRIRRNIYDITPPSTGPGDSGGDDGTPDTGGIIPVDQGKVPEPGGRKIPSFLPKNRAVPIEIVPPKPLKVVMEDTFSIDKTEIYKDFINKLRLVIEKYMRELLYIAEAGGFPSYKDLFYDYSVSSKDLPDNLKHVGDEIIRSQIERSQKSKFFQKIYNIDQTIYHLRSNKISHELRRRYYEENYGKSQSYLETNSNDILRGSRLQYDKKYQQNMYNFYKYLNSSVILVDEVLQTFVKESKGKALLNKEGVDIYKGVREEEELAEKVKKQREERIKKRHTEATSKEKERLERYKKAGKNPNGNAYNNGSSSSTVVPTGDNAKVVELAQQWVQTRGVGSSNPVIYSMELRGSDMELKKYGDCSSFTRRIFLDAGKGDIGWTTAQQATNDKGHFFTDRSQLQPGDLMFFSPTGSHGHPVTLPNGQSAKTAHVAIFIGGTQMIDLAYGVGGISNKNFSSGQYKSYVDGHFIGAMRF
jgi:cell wall-associated NlpC family hydrolase